MKKPIRNILAGTAVAAATMLGSLNAVRVAKGDLISFSLDLTSRNTTTLNRDGFEYDPHMHATEYFTLDTAQAGTLNCAGNSGYAVLDTLGGQETTPMDNSIEYGVGGGLSGGAMGVLGNIVGFDANANGGLPNFNNNGASTEDFQQFFINYDTLGAYTPTAVYAYTTLDSPLFNINSITVTAIPEPKSAALLLGGGLVALGLSARRRRHELALS